jgi:hypothetical protein
MILSQKITFAQDTIPAVTPERTKKSAFSAEPMRATMLAVAFPGLGQLYNRKYWKVPFVYAGFGGLAFAVTFNSTHYNEFMKGYQDFRDNIPQTVSYEDLEMFAGANPEDYDPVRHPETYDASTASWYQDRMLKGIDYFKKYRDLSYIGFAVWYLVTILDANVDASLFNYDISDNLDLDVVPVQMSFSGKSTMGVNVSLKVNF